LRVLALKLSSVIGSKYYLDFNQESEGHLVNYRIYIIA
jgi:hypothetical protein